MSQPVGVETSVGELIPLSTVSHSINDSCVVERQQKLGESNCVPSSESPEQRQLDKSSGMRYRPQTSRGHSAAPLGLGQAKETSAEDTEQELVLQNPMALGPDGSVIEWDAQQGQYLFACVDIESEDELESTLTQTSPHTSVDSLRSCTSGSFAKIYTCSASFTAQRPVPSKPLSSRCRQARTSADSWAVEEARERARLAISPPVSPAFGPQASPPPSTSITIPNQCIITSLRAAPSARKFCAPATHAPCLPLSPQDLRCHCYESSVSPGFEVVGKRRVYKDEDKAPSLPLDRPLSKSRRKTISQVGKTIVERLIEVTAELSPDDVTEDDSNFGTCANCSSTLGRPLQGTSTATGAAIGCNLDDDFEELSAPGFEVMRTSGLTAHEIQSISSAAMPNETVLAMTNSSASDGDLQTDQPEWAEWAEKRSDKKLCVETPKRKRRPASSASVHVCPSVKVKGKNTGESSYSADSFDNLFDDDAISQAKALGPFNSVRSTDTKRRRRPHKGVKRILPPWSLWEDLMITHKASNGKLGSTAQLLEKINARREGEGLETRIARDLSNRWRILKATLETRR